MNQTADSNPVSPQPVVTPLPAHDTTASRRVERQLDQLDELSSALGQDESRVATGLKTTDGTASPIDTLNVPPEFVLSIVIPVYNEAATICDVLHRVMALPVPKEIIVVDDASTDGTHDLLREFDEDCRIIYQDRNQGKGAALRAGFLAATGTVIAIQDADLEYDPNDLLHLLPPIINDEADVVYGSRFLGDSVRDPSWLHRFGNALLTRASNLFTGLRLTDMETCYKVFRSTVLRELPLQQDRFGFEPEITARLARRGYRFCERPIDYHGRGYEDGKKIGMKDAVNALYCIVRYGVLD